MADFSRLPNEMISEVWGNIQEPEDVESFALVSKHVYAIGEPFVEEHNKLKEDFAFIEIGHMMDRTDVVAPARLLEKVLLRPRIALYVMHLSIGPILPYWDPSDDDNGGVGDDECPNDGHIPYPENVMALFMETIQKPSFMPGNETSGWIKSVRDGDEDPIIALLLTLLPNLTMVTLTNDGSDAWMSQQTILRIAKAEKMLFLTRLVTVNILSETYEGDNVFNWLTTFAALPSVQSLHMDHVRTERVDAVFESEYFVPDSYSIRELTFTDSDLHPQILAPLLNSVKGLKVFSYVGPNGNLAPDAECCQSQLWIWNALLANAKHSLECLTILYPWTEELTFVGTLRGFTSLKEIQINLHLLCPCRGFGLVVPSSIEKIEIDTVFLMTHDIGPRLVEEIVTAKSRLIPHLKTLILRTTLGSRTAEEGKSMIETLEEKCQNVGIELTVNESYQRHKLYSRS